MKLERVDLIHIRMPLVSPFETSMGRHNDLEKLLLKVYTPDGTAYSECVASAKPFYGQETIGTARHMLKDFILPTILGRDMAGADEYLKMISPFRGHAMAKAVVENALWVLRAAEEGRGLSEEYLRRDFNRKLSDCRRHWTKQQLNRPLVVDTTLGSYRLLEKES